MGEAKRRRDAIARGESDPGPSARTPCTSTRRTVIFTKPGEAPEERSEMWDGVRKHERERLAMREAARKP